MEEAEFRSIEKVRFFGNQSAIVQLRNSAVILHNGKIVSRFPGERVFVDDYCNSGFPTYLCIENEQTTEYSLMTADHGVLVHSFLHIHSHKREKPNRNSQLVQTSDFQSKPIETGRSLFFFGLRNRLMVLEKELKQIRTQEEEFLSIKRFRNQSTHWNRLIEGKTLIRSNTAEISTVHVQIERVQSWKIGESIKIELEGAWDNSNSNAFFWCYCLCQNCVIHSKRNQMKNGRFRSVITVSGIKVISKDQSFFFFVNSDGTNCFVKEYRLELEPYDSSDYALLYNEHDESCKINHFLENIPGIQFSLVNSSAKYAHLSTDLQTMIQIERIVRKLDPHSNVFLDRLTLQMTEEIIESVCDTLLNELLLIREEKIV